MNNHGQLFSSFVLVSLVLTGLCTLLGFWGEVHPLLDLIGQFRVFYVLGLSLFCLLLLALRRFKFSLLASLLVLINLLPLLPYYQNTNTVKTAQPTLKLLQFNTWASNKHPEKIVKLLREAQPDLVAFEEYTPETHQFLQNSGALKAFPYQTRYRKDRLALFSKFPLIGRPETTPWPPTLKATIQWENTRLNVLVVHTWRPLHKDYPAQIRKLGSIINQANTPLIVTGDFNTAPWSHYYRQLLQETQLKDAELGFGIHPTYPAIIPKTQIPFPLPMPPLDHVLLSPELQAVQYQYAPRAGSDHLPLVNSNG